MSVKCIHQSRNQFEMSYLPFSFSTQDPVTMLLDGNKTLYPVAKNAIGGIRDPNWLDLPPLQALGIGVHFLTHPSLGTNMKTKAAVIAVAVKVLLDHCVSHKFFLFSSKTGLFFTICPQQNLNRWILFFYLFFHRTSS